MTKVLAGGAFNSFHRGHEYFLKEARKLGDFLVVVIACDETVLKNKGYLLRPASERKRLVEQSGLADRVIIGDRKDFMKTVGKEKPDIVALGYDQEFDETVLRKAGCRVARIGKLEGYSTRKMLQKKPISS